MQLGPVGVVVEGAEEEGKGADCLGVRRGGDDEEVLLGGLRFLVFLKRLSS